MSVLCRELVKMGEMQLREAGIESAAVDAELLYRFQFGLDKMGYFQEWGREISDELCERYFSLVSKRASRIPLQHITGTQEFCGHEFEVSKNVLIPRQDTELLVEAALSEALEIRRASRRGAALSVLDLCTGSGCIAISLALADKSLRVSCSDISPDAVSLAKKNAKKLGAKVDIREGDLFKPFKKLIGNEKFDLIVSNPPYIRTDVIPTLEPEVSLNEPKLALDGGEDGLAFYLRILEEAPLYLKPHGRLLFEIGADQGEALREISGNQAEILQDLSGFDRIAIIR